ncbi:MAG: TraR/DksA family transcriptional regulator [Gammaproteobacteria bacterium]|nr:TraR/DksA family transcriptional regulator [Gammaproteobacteria bacterium]MCW8986051.1 TraR/DksA family transcriptional regulator [Gammaproteobacteria bacterium]MCW9031517.1 TraR/DksA family transcriptional regulator [Gammaproteobacteria bacterium]
MHDLDYFKQQLLSRKDDITDRINAIDKDIKHEGMSPNWTEQATERENDEVLESLGIASEQELLMINNALKRIESGEYFVCSMCGEEIPPSRLELLPFSSHCVNCAGKAENH